MGARVAAPRQASPGRASRKKPQPDTRPAYDPTCYLCPGNARARRRGEPAVLEHQFVFDNDFAALLPARRNRLV
ncbi:MAG: hypothetical protein WKG07_44680 [Hymenobacter sp.]